MLLPLLRVSLPTPSPISPTLKLSPHSAFCKPFSPIKFPNFFLLCCMPPNKPKSPPFHPPTQILHPHPSNETTFPFPNQTPQVIQSPYSSRQVSPVLIHLRDPTPCSGRPRNGSVIPLSTPSKPDLPQVCPRFDQFPPVPAFPQSPTVSLTYVIWHLNPL